MQYTALGRTGVEVSRLCLGTMNFGSSADKNTSFAIMDAAYDAGITFFDSADIYSRWVKGNVGGESETILGQWLKTRDRSTVIVATKVRGRMWRGPDGEGLSRAHIIRAVEDSLRRLDTDYLDLYQSHWPDDGTPLEETFAMFDTLVKSGKVRHIGCSNHTLETLKQTLQVSEANNVVRYDCLQPHYSMLHRREFEGALADLCREENLGVIPYSPLAAGFLTGKYTRENKSPDTTRSGGGLIQQLIDDENAYSALDVIRDIASDHGVPVAQIGLAWQLAQDVITAPIIGARTVAQLQQVISTVDVTLAADEIERLNTATVMF